MALMCEYKTVKDNTMELSVNKIVNKINDDCKAPIIYM